MNTRLTVSFSAVYFSETVKQLTGKRTNPIVLLLESTVHSAQCTVLVPKVHSLTDVTNANRQERFVMSRYHINLDR